MGRESGSPNVLVSIEPGAEPERIAAPRPSGTMRTTMLAIVGREADSLTCHHRAPRRRPASEQLAGRMEVSIPG